MAVPDLLAALVRAADTNGRLRANPKLIRWRLFPLEDDLTVAEVAGELAALEAVGRIVTDPDGDRDMADRPMSVLTLVNRRQYRRYAKRLGIPATVRRRVYERDGYACRTCGALDDLSIDHVVPLRLGGSDEIGNLRVLCRSCNSRKGARP